MMAGGEQRDKERHELKLEESKTKNLIKQLQLEGLIKSQAPAAIIESLQNMGNSGTPDTGITNAPFSSAGMNRVLVQDDQGNQAYYDQTTGKYFDLKGNPL